MKILLYLTTIIYTCYGGITSGYGGNLVQEIEIEPQQLQHIHQVQIVDQGHHQEAPQQLFNTQSAGNGISYDGNGGGQSEWQPLSNINNQESAPQIIKIVHEHAPDNQGRHGGFGGQFGQPQIIKIIEEPSFDGNHIGASNQPHQIIKIIEDRPSRGHGHKVGHSLPHNFGGHGSPSQSEPQIIFADPPSVPFTSSSETSSQSFNPLSSLGSIIPQLFRFLFGGGDSTPSLPSLHGHRAINTPNAGKLINTYGYGGSTKITKAGKIPNSYYKSGRVIESGTLKISSVKKGGKW